MTRKTLWALLLLTVSVSSAWAHRIDEYLQASIISLEPGVVHITMRMVPGVAIADQIIGRIDLDHDGSVSTQEQASYAKQVLADLSLQEDGTRLPLRLAALRFPALSEMKAGTGEIVLTFDAPSLKHAGSHVLSMQNHHLPTSSVYLVNALVPQTEDLRIQEQQRNPNQSFYRLSFVDSGRTNAAGEHFSMSGFGAAFRLGTRHIAEGTDHLLFLLTLLLPAPLLASRSRWSGIKQVRTSVADILRIVTAFTVGHSLTLALAAFGLLKVPQKPIEVLIAVSILASALHAFRPLFPGRESFVAGSFGLIHGLAFASTLSELGYTGWYRLVSVLGFNLGIEAMQLLIVALVMPSLLLLSRTQFYSAFRIAGASVALAASCAWLVERTTDRPNIIAADVEAIARYGAPMAGALFLLSVLLFYRAKTELRLGSEPRVSR